MTEEHATNSGTTSKPSEPSGNGLAELSMSDLMTMDRHDERRQEEIAGPATGEGEEPIDLRGKIRGGDDDADLPELSGKDPPASDLASRLDGLSAEEKAEFEAILKSLGSDADDGPKAKRSRGLPEKDDRLRPPGVSKDQRTLKMIAEDLDVDPATFYEDMMIPLGDGTDRHVSLEKLRSGYLGTDADQVHKDRVEHEQRLAAFEVDKSEHESRMVRDRQEVSGMMKLLQQHLPPNAIKAAQLASQKQLAQSAADMLERFPAWRDPKVAGAWQNKAAACLKRFGFSKADAQAITDPRLCQLLDHHMKLHDWAAKVRNPQTVPKRPASAARNQSRSESPKGSKRNEILAAAKAPGASREAKTAGIVALLYPDGLPGR